MAKLRRNHERRKGSSSWIGRLGTIGMLFLAGAVYLYNNYGADLFTQKKQDHRHYTETATTPSNVTVTDKTMLPTSSTGEVIPHQYYTLSYVDEHEQAEWVAYELTKNSLKAKNVKRTNWFEEDKAVNSGSAIHADYKGSGYSRGHLAPAGDMAFNTTAMKESFFMSNMSPQKSVFNGGVWNELENHVRNWAWDNGSIYVVTGPILTRGHIVKRIGRKNSISVPDSYYKVILDYTGKSKKGIAFILPNEKSEKRIQEYAVSIDQVEDITGIDFFADAPIDRIDNLESSFNINDWRIDNDLYLQRVNKWNNR